MFRKSSCGITSFRVTFTPASAKTKQQTLYLCSDWPYILRIPTFQHFNNSLHYMNIHILAFTLWDTKCRRGFLFPRYRIIHIRTSTFRPTIYQTRFLFPLASSTNGSHANHKRYSEPIRSQENNTIFFASNSNDIHVHRPRYSEPFRSQDANMVFFTSNSNVPSDKVLWTIPFTKEQQGFVQNIII